MVKNRKRFSLSKHGKVTCLTSGRLYVQYYSSIYDCEVVHPYDEDTEDKDGYWDNNRS